MELFLACGHTSVVARSPPPPPNPAPTEYVGFNFESGASIVKCPYHPLGPTSWNVPITRYLQSPCRSFQLLMKLLVACLRHLLIVIPTQLHILQETWRELPFQKQIPVFRAEAQVVFLLEFSAFRLMEVWVSVL